MHRTLPTAAVATGLALLAVAAPAAQAAPRATLAGTIPTYVGKVPALGAALPTSRIHALIDLKDRDFDGLKSFVASVSEPSSPNYEHYLSSAEFNAKYAPSGDTVSKVEDYARANGLTVMSVPSNHAFVEVSGTVADAEKAFSTTLSRYRYKNADVMGPSTPLSIPASLQDVVTAVDGLDTGDVAHSDAGPPPAYVNTGECSTSWASTIATGVPPAYGAMQPAVPCGYTPKQLQGAYGLTSAHATGLDGTGQKVAIIDAYSSPLITDDVTEYSKRHGLPVPNIELHDNGAQSSQPEGATPPSDIPIAGGLNLQDPQGWAGEETLDVEAVHSMAPGAQILYYGALAPQNATLRQAQNKVVTDNLAKIVSNSYGGTTDSTDTKSDATWMQAAAQGQGVYFSSGDDGDMTAGGTTPATRTVDGGGNSPYVTSVGGTTLAVDDKDKYEFETYWGTFSSTLTDGKFDPAEPGTFNSGGGGGTSQVYAEPDYQKSVVPAKFSGYWDAKTTADGKVDGSVADGRVTPDVAMVGDPNSGFLMGMMEDFTQYSNPGSASLPAPLDDLHYGEYRIGGTSLSSPLMAGVMAVADQAAGKPHGFANPVLYAANGTGAFRDITKPASTIAVVRRNFDNATNADGGTSTFLRTAGQTGTLSSEPGYDDSTGLGSPKGLAFLSALAPGSALVAAAEAAEGSSGTTTTTTTTTTPPPTETTPPTDATPAGTTPTSTTAAPAPASTTPASATPVATTPTASTPASTPKGCTPPTTLVYALHAGTGQRVVRVALTVGGRTLVNRRGTRLTKVTIPRPKGTTFTVSVTSTTNRGAVTKSSRTYTASGCAKTAPKVSHDKLARKRK